MTISNAELAQDIVDLIGLFDAREIELQGWMTGPVNGGPNGDGTYPLTDRLGTTIFAKSPAQLEAELFGIYDSASVVITGGTITGVVIDAGEYAGGGTAVSTLDPGSVGDAGSINGNPVDAQNPDESDLLQYLSGAWRNVPKQNLVDGGNF